MTKLCKSCYDRSLHDCRHVCGTIRLHNDLVNILLANDVTCLLPLKNMSSHYVCADEQDLFVCMYIVCLVDTLCFCESAHLFLV